MNDHKPWEFTCKTCGGHGITVFRNWTVLAGPASESWQEWGPLEANHLWRFEFKKRIEKEEETLKLRDGISLSMQRIPLLLNRKSMRYMSRRKTRETMSFM